MKSKTVERLMNNMPKHIADEADKHADKIVNKTNPYQLVWYRADWSDAKVKKNNTKYWEWEMKHNNFVPSNSRKK